MRRRRLLGLGAAGLAALAGCSSARQGDPQGDPNGTAGGRTGTAAAATTGSPSPGSGGGTTGGGPGAGTTGPAGPPGTPDLPVDPADLARATPRDAIPAIVDPAYAPDYGGVDEDLPDGSVVIGVERDGRARAYPVSVVSVHEVVNDEFGGPLLVTYCSLCNSPMTAVRRVRGEPAVFGVSGLLYRSNLVMYDRATGSLWSQVLARAIRGRATGDALELVPSTLARWGDWRSAHPDGEVLLPPPRSGVVNRASTAGLQAGYDGGHVGIPEDFDDTDDDRLPARELVIGLAAGGVARAYALSAVRAAGVVEDVVGGLPVVVVAGPGGTLHAYDRRVGGETLSFAPHGGDPTRIRGGGTTWSVVTGRGLSGRLAGRRLARAGGRTMLWFAWAELRPDTEVYRP